MKKLLTYCFLVIASFGLLGAPFVASANAAQVARQQLDKLKAEAPNKILSNAQPGYFFATGQEITSANMWNTMVDRYYYKTDGKVLLKYRSPDNLADDWGSARTPDPVNDVLVEASVLSGTEVKTVPKPAGVSDADFMFNVARENNIATGANTAAEYQASHHRSALKGQKSLRELTTESQNYANDIDAYNKKVAELTARINALPEGSEERETLESELAVLKAQRQDVIDKARPIDTQVAGNKAAFEAGKVKTTFAGLGLCGQWMYNVTAGKAFGGGAPEWDLKGCIAAFVNLGIEAVSIPFVYVTELLDHVMDYSLTTFGSKFAKEGPLYEPVNSVWNLIKNICNLLFIVTLLYIAIKTIIDADGFQERKTLIAVIICAVLINFSMLFTKLLIDVSNAASIQVFNVLAESTEVSNNSNAASQIGNNSLTKAIKADVGTRHSLANIFLSNMQIQKFVESGAGQQFGHLDYGYIFAYGLLSIIFILVATVVIGVIVGMLIVRFVTLVLLLMTSPIAFLKYFAPGPIANYSNMWQQKFKENLIFLPVLMIMFYITMVFAQFVSIKVRNSPNNYIEMIFGYVMTLSMLVASMAVAKNLGGSAGAANWGSKWARGIIGGATFGLAARGTRRVIAGGGGALMRGTGLNKLAKNVANSNSFLLRATGASALAKGALKGGEKIQNATFDARNTGAVGALGLGDGLKGGYAEVLKGRKESAEERAKYAKEKFAIDEKKKAEMDLRSELHDQHKRANDRKREADEAKKKADEEVADLSRKLVGVADAIDEKILKEKQEVTREIDANQKEINRLFAAITAGTATAAERTEWANRRAEKSRLEQKRTDIGNDRGTRITEETTRLNEKLDKAVEGRAKVVERVKEADGNIKVSEERIKDYGYKDVSKLKTQVANDKKLAKEKKKEYLDYLETNAQKRFWDLDKSFASREQLDAYRNELAKELKGLYTSKDDDEMKKLLNAIKERTKDEKKEDKK